MKRPSFQFYPADWRKDAELQSCSLAARGLWHEAMCIMHECEPYGELRVNGQPMSTAQLARLAGITSAECKRLLAELEAAGVPSRTEDGAIYSRRMVRDEALRNARAAGGEAGAEHGAKGAEHGSKGGRPREQTGDKKPPLEPPENPPPSSSSSSSSSSSGERPSSLRSDGAASLCDAQSQAKPPDTPKPDKRKARASIPDDCPTEFERTWAVNHWREKGRPDLAETITDQAAQFRDHHAKEGSRFADWPAAWRTWVRNALRFTRPPQTSARPGQMREFSLEEIIAAGKSGRATN